MLNIHFTMTNVSHCISHKCHETPICSVVAVEADHTDYKPRERKDGTSEDFIRLELDPMKEHADLIEGHEDILGEWPPEVVSKICVYNHDLVEKKLNMMMISIYEDFSIEPKVAAQILPTSELLHFLSGYTNYATRELMDAEPNSPLTFQELSAHVYQVFSSFRD